MQEIEWRGLYCFTLNKKIMENLLNTIRTAAFILAEDLMNYVRKHGEDYSDNPDYWGNEFGIYEEDGCKVTKVLDFFGEDGCESITQRRVNPDIDIDSCESFDDLLEKTDDEFTHKSFLQLYIEQSNDGGEVLRYNSFFNTGIYHSDGLSEPDHGCVRNLNLSDIENIIYVINNTFEK